MFERSAESQATGRYRVDLVSGEMRQKSHQKSHQKSVQETLDEGSASRWRLVSANTTNASSVYVTAVYWDTTP